MGDSKPRHAPGSTAQSGGSQASAPPCLSGYGPSAHSASEADIAKLAHVRFFQLQDTLVASLKWVKGNQLPATATACVANAGFAKIHSDLETWSTELHRALPQSVDARRYRENVERHIAIIDEIERTCNRYGSMALAIGRTHRVTTRA